VADSTYSPEEIQRVRDAGNALATQLGIGRMAHELAVRPIALMSALKAGRLSTDIVEGIARLGGVSVAELLGRVSIDPLPKRSEAMRLARQDGLPEKAIASVLEVDSKTAASRTVVEWLLAIREAAAGPPTQSAMPTSSAGPPEPALLMVTPRPVATPAITSAARESSRTVMNDEQVAPSRLVSEQPSRPRVQPIASALTATSGTASFGAGVAPIVGALTPVEIEAARHPEPAIPATAAATGSGIPGIPGEQTGILMAIAANQAALSLSEYASLSMGLELLPHRRDDVFNYFGLKTEAARENEVQAWTQTFEKNPREKREWDALRGHSRHFWIRFDKQSASSPPATSEAEISTSFGAPLPSVFVATAPAPEPPPPPPVSSPSPPARATSSSTPTTGAANPTAVYDPIGGGGTQVYHAIVEAPPGPVASRGAELPRLSLETYANVSAEAHFAPQRAEEIFARHGLTNPAVRQAVHEAWQQRLQSNPGDQWEWQRLYGLRYSALQEEARRRQGASPASAAASHAAPPIALEAYAALCAELHRNPANTEAVFGFYGLNDARGREAVSRYWTDRLAHYPNERAEWERLYREKAQELEMRASRAPVAPLPQQYVSAVKPRVADAAPSMSLAVYALLCVELEKSKDRERVYKRHGLQDPARRRAVEEEWQARLARDPAEMAKWQKLTDEIRADWMDL
jgi:hypothetical protein